MIKRIHTIHHYLGTFFFGLFLMWFLSGFVMMYKSFPFLSEIDRIAANEVMPIDSRLHHPLDVFPEYKNEGVCNIRTNSILGYPVYHLITKEGRLISRYVHSKKAVIINQKKAIQIAENFTSLNSKTSVEILEEVDQWIPRPKYAKHLPVYKVCFDNEDKTYVHISSKTGEVISNTTGSERFWAWIGAIPHWIYFKEVRMHSTLWSQLIIWLSALGFIMALSGIITGIVRYKKKPNAKFKRFKNKWYNLHYYTGLAFGLFVCTWIFSGLMSMTPFNWSSSSSLSEQETLIWEGETKTIENVTPKEWNSLQNAVKSGHIKEIHFSAFSDRLYSKQFFDRTSASTCLSRINYQPSACDISHQVGRMNKADSVVNISLLQQYDNYYYDRKDQKKLPVFKATIQNTLTYYIDPSDGKVLQKSDASNKLERWLYHGLHSLDFAFLVNNRPLWDIIMIFLLLGGTAISVTATGLGIKFIRRKRKKYLKQIQNG